LLQKIHFAFIFRLAKLTIMEETLDSSLKEVVNQQKILGKKLDLLRVVFERPAYKVGLGAPADNERVRDLLKSEVFVSF